MNWSHYNPVEISELLDDAIAEGQAAIYAEQGMQAQIDLLKRQVKRANRDRDTARWLFGVALLFAVAASFWAGWKS
jgi:cell division septum initiation protein DivIVA